MNGAPWWRGTRGEWYVVVQVGLFLLVGFGPRELPGVSSWGPPLSVFTLFIGLVLGGAGGLLALAGLLCLGANLTPLPHPKDDATLVETGAYALVRHPIYGGLSLAAFGWALVVASPLTLLYALLLFIFFDLKSGREERQLLRKFERYAEYQKRVRKLIPFVY
ncbi:MAG: isoprenylcysteine carboxylmethyltransferase family protein [Anaerolineales bacterium]|nr:isoprenylcysteine carboxylmethyltransferase family protein [Anaerolineales bacterium]